MFFFFLQISSPGLAVVGVDNSHGVWQKSCCLNARSGRAKSSGTSSTASLTTASTIPLPTTTSSGSGLECGVDDPGTSGWTNFIGDEIFGMFAPALPTSRRATLLGRGCRVRFVPRRDFNTRVCKQVRDFWSDAAESGKWKMAFITLFALFDPLHVLSYD